MRFAALLAAALCLAGCGALARDYRDPDTRTVRAGEVVDASATATLTGRTVRVMIPSGRLDLVVTKPVTSVAGHQASAPLHAAKGQQLVGVSWTLQRGAYQDSPNRQLASPDAIFGTPRPVTLTLLGGPNEIVIPRTGTLVTPSGRPRTAVWVSVPTNTFEQIGVTYDGVTQYAVPGNGLIVPGRAKPLYDVLPLDHDGVCRYANADTLDSCLIDYATGYPYADGAGWAPANTRFLLLRVAVDVSRAPTTLTVDGRPAVATVADSAQRFAVFEVRRVATTYAVAGTADVQVGTSTVRTTLSATLTTADVP